LASKSDVGWLALLHLRTNESIFSLESMVGEGRLRAVRFFGNLAAVGTLFYLMVVYNKNGGTVCPPIMQKVK
jgi:hypothetical protein